jgi:hypothetical protein
MSGLASESFDTALLRTVTVEGGPTERGEGVR